MAIGRGGSSYKAYTGEQKSSHQRYQWTLLLKEQPVGELIKPTWACAVWSKMEARSKKSRLETGQMGSIEVTQECNGTEEGKRIAIVDSNNKHPTDPRQTD